MERGDVIFQVHEYDLYKKQNKKQTNKKQQNKTKNKTKHVTNMENDLKDSYFIFR